MNKYLFLLLIPFSLCSGISNKYGMIEFRHIGACDKPIRTLLIVTHEKPSDTETRVVVVSKKTFDCLFEYLSNRKEMGKLCTDTVTKYGSFKITSIGNDRKGCCYIIEGRKPSLAFFLSTTDYLIQHDMDKRLIDEIEKTIIHRIKNAPPIGSGLE